MDANHVSRGWRINDSKAVEATRYTTAGGRTGRSWSPRTRWGRGYAPESARAAGTWAFANHDVDRLVTVPNRDNLKSVRVAEKLGMTLDHYEVLHGTDSAVYTISRATWETRTGG
ncbi:GNAT family N-acetyltransferase [Frankia sp. Cr2]|uniref:GNAT family N-acetyltransferase n=1 Tax=Frankia sp. Cr2 TaxID=3073932 RepID=UPI002AD47A72|nr:GNAT family N-acetyltransferase [Frankia sp. Cr2]